MVQPHIEQPGLSGWLFLHEFLPFENLEDLDMNIRVEVTEEVANLLDGNISSRVSIVATSDGWGIPNLDGTFPGQNYILTLDRVPGGNNWGQWSGNNFGQVFAGRYTVRVNGVDIQVFCMHPWRSGPSQGNMASGMTPDSSVDFLRNGPQWNLYRSDGISDAEAIFRTRIAVAEWGSIVSGYAPS